MSITGCTHPETDVVVLGHIGGGGVRWCQLCGSVRDALWREWRAPSGLLLPGWTCAAVKDGVPCRAFNGAAKEVLTVCRACDTPRRSA